MVRYLSASISILTAVMLTGLPGSFASTPKETGNPVKVIAVETFLADIAQNVAGTRLKIKALLPVGADPHTFQPTPADVRSVVESNVLVINGGGFEEYLDELLKNIGGVRKVIDSSAGLTFRIPGEYEPTDSDQKDDTRGVIPRGGKERDTRDEHHHDAVDHGGGDPHFWLSAANVIHYVENIRHGLSEADPGGADLYAANARAYTEKLKELDQWISDQVKQIPENRRLFVTDHDDLGYFADRYGFRIVGMIIPSLSTEASPSAKQVAQLVKNIRKTGVKAIFLEAGEALQLAEQIAKEAGIKVVTGLYTHSTSQPGGLAPSYIEMMHYNTITIVNSLK